MFVRILSIVALLTVASLAISQETPAARIKRLEDQLASLKSPPSKFDVAYAKAVAENIPLVVWASANPPAFVYVNRAAVVAMPLSHERLGRESIIIHFPDGAGGFKNGFRYDMMPDADVQALVDGKQVQPMARPFSVSRSGSLRPGEVETADGSQLAASSWPKGLTFLHDLEPYTTATQTQLSFRRWSGFIGSAPRSSVEAKWNVPGGLLGLHGWSSQLLKRASANVYLGRQDPSDGDSTVTWMRSYADGSVFADVLRNASGKVFEVRGAERKDGRWDRFIAFRDPKAYPVGYVPLTTRQCAGCHDQAGISAYGGSAIPGAGGVLSDPIPDVENGRVVQGGFGTRLQP